METTMNLTFNSKDIHMHTQEGSTFLFSITLEVYTIVYNYTCYSLATPESILVIT